MYPMNSEYLTGITVLDEQHSQLFRLTDEAQTLLKDENMLYKFDDLEKIMKELRDYTFSHFIEEEAFMAKSLYAKIDEHKKLHQIFVDNLNQIEEEISRISLGTQDSILSELLACLTEWLQKHILVIDQEMVKEAGSAE